MHTITRASLLLVTTFAFVSCIGDADVTGPQLASKTHASEGKAQGYYNLAVASEKAGKLGKATRNYRIITSKYPLSPIAADAAYRQAKILESQGELIESFEAYNNLLQKYPASSNYAEAIKSQETIAHQAAEGHITNSFIGIKSRIDVAKTTDMLSKVRDNAPQAPSADRAQFAIGEVQQSRGGDKQGAARAIFAYEQLVRDYPDSKYGPEAQYRVGEILLGQATAGNQDTANLDRAEKAFQEVIDRYPDSKRAKEARTQIAQLRARDNQRSYDVAEFYRKKGQNSSALFYYREALDSTKSADIRSKAQAWINQLSSQ